jgi:hypothetical protein
VYPSIHQLSGKIEIDEREEGREIYAREEKGV